MSIPIAKVTAEAERVFDEINRTYHGGALPKYSFAVVSSLPDAPANAVAQTDGPAKTIYLRLDLWPRDEGGIPEEQLRNVLAHESIHARLFADDNPNWKSCASDEFKEQKAKIPIAR